MAYINSDGSEATKDVGQIGVENDDSAQGVQAVSVKEGLGRRANRLGSFARADSGGALVALNNAGVTLLTTLAAPGAGLRHHLILVSLMLVGGTVGSDWGFFAIAWTADDGAHSHIVYANANATLSLVLEGQIATAQDTAVTISAQAGTAALKAMASQSVMLPNV